MQQALGVPPEHCRRNALWVERMVGEVERNVRRSEGVLLPALSEFWADVEEPAA